MKQAIIWIVLGVLALGGVYWFMYSDRSVGGDDPMVNDSSDERSEDGYVGLTVSAAEAVAMQNEVPFRVVERDGEPLMVTKDYRPGRINAVVTDGVVTAYTVEGNESEPVADGNKQGDPNANTYDFGEPVANDDLEPEPEPTPEPAANYVGLTEAAAAALAEQNNVPFRVVERDGQPLDVTEDFRPGRINASIVDGIVTAYTVEGAAQGAPEQNLEPAEEPSPTAEGGHDVIIGMTEEEAEAYAEANGVEFRIGSVDGEPRSLTMDYRPGRITASIEDNVVISYTIE